MSDKTSDAPKNETVTNITNNPFHVDWEEVRNIVGWIAGCAMVAAVIWAPVSCSKNNNEKMEAAIKAGSNPIDAACAFSNQPPVNACLLRAATLSKGESK